MTFWMDSKRWKAEKASILGVYPDAQARELMDEGANTRAWRLSFDPIPAEAVLSYVLSDLEIGLTVSIGQKGKISHSDHCPIPLNEHHSILKELKLPEQTYVVDLIYRPQKHNATWSTQPKAIIINPEISVRTFPAHPHLYVNNKESWACPLSPQDNNWAWEHGGGLAYLDQVAIWLLKTAVWIRTGGGVARLGKWIGPDTSHQPSYLLQQVKLDEPCWCGSGVKYKQCHMKSDAVKVIVSEYKNQTN